VCVITTSPGRGAESLLATCAVSSIDRLLVITYAKEVFLVVWSVGFSVNRITQKVTDAFCEILEGDGSHFG